MNSENNRFESLTVFVLASNEIESLNSTVSRIGLLKYIDDIHKIIIVLKSKDCPAYSEAEKIAELSDGKIKIYIQKSDSLELCIAELPGLVESTHFVITAADGEMEIENIDTFISKAKKHPERVICAAKWHKDSIVQGYGKFNAFGSRCINMFVSVLFNKKVSDPFSIYQIFPISVYHRLNYKNSATFAYEYTVKVLRNGVEYEEIPTFYQNRTEGKTNFNYMELFRSAFLFCLVALRVRLSSKENVVSEYEVNE